MGNAVGCRCMLGGGLLCYVAGSVCARECVCVHASVCARECVCVCVCVIIY